MSSVKRMLEEADQSVARVTAEEAHELISGRDALLVDVRDPSELSQSGKLRGALNVSRGMLEFRADPDAAQHDVQFRKERPLIVYCASGGRSALAGRTLQKLGYAEVYNLGGFKAAAADGFPTEPG